MSIKTVSKTIISETEPFTSHRIVMLDFNDPTRDREYNIRFIDLGYEALWQGTVSGFRDMYPKNIILTVANQK